MVTVEELDRLLESTDGTYYELHQGELVKLPLPSWKHQSQQHRLLGLLKPLAKGKGSVFIKMPFRAQPEHEWRSADVGYVRQERVDAIDDDLFGAPDIIIEVLSPSNTYGEMQAKEELCLANGCQQFWMLSPKKQTVSVTTAEGTIVYQRGQTIPIVLLDGEIRVNDIFGAEAS